MSFLYFYRIEFDITNVDLDILSIDRNYSILVYDCAIALEMKVTVLCNLATLKTFLPVS